MSRRFPRIRTRLTATVTIEGSEAVLVCHTRDISQRGCFLDTAQILAPGTRVIIAVLDAARGVAMEVEGQVARCLPPDDQGVGRGVGVRFDHPPAEWDELVTTYQQLQDQQKRERSSRRQRLRVLVVGDRARQRSAMALYVTSGWDIRFATDLEGAEDALAGVQLNAVIAESNLSDIRWQEVMAAARRLQPEARRIVRSGAGGAIVSQAEREQAMEESPLYHQIVDRDAGLEALLEALLRSS